jgi:glycosyltransferase involved in cell wall biosynthesis
MEQTYPTIEHIIVDGGSSDETINLVHQFPHIGKIISEKDNGIYDAMNKGIAMATGEVIGFINADDFYADPEVLSSVMRVFDESDTDICYGDLCYVKQSDTTAIVRYWRSSKFKAGLFFHGWCPPHPTFFVRRAVYERCGSFDLEFSIGADVELMMRFLEVHGVRSFYLPKILVRMRMGGTTNRSLANVIKQNKEIWRAFRKNELSPSLITFVAGKLFSRSRQFISRPHRA